MADLVPLKVKIGLKENGHAKYPSFNSIPDEARMNMDWSHYIDRYGTRWHYDKKCGHDDHEDGSPCGMQWGVFAVPAVFAAEALKLFGPAGEMESGLVTELSEAEFETFYNERAHAHEPEEKIDTKIVQDLAAKKALGISLSQLEQDALDPAKPQPGILPNTNKTWAGFKGKRGLTVVPRLAKVAE